MAEIASIAQKEATLGELEAIKPSERLARHLADFVELRIRVGRLRIFIAHTRASSDPPCNYV